MRLLIAGLLVLSLLLTGCRLRNRHDNDATATPTPGATTTATPSAAATLSPAPDSTDAASAPTDTPAPVGGNTSECGEHAAGESDGTIVTDDGRTRTYRLYVPGSYDGATPMPLVLNFHGYGSNAREQEAYSAMPAAAEANGFITVAPDGTGSPQEWWLVGSILPGYVDDFAFTRQLVTKLESELCIDPARVYATGISNGAAFASLAACQLNDVLAAVAPVAAEPYSDYYCPGKSPVPIIAFHGTDDQLVPFEGGSSLRGLPVKPARENMQGWAAFNGCDPTLQSNRVASDVVREWYGDCTNGADTELYVIEGGGHTWPGAHDVFVLGDTTHSIDATSLLWEFFAAHPKR
jgi:polyhydroxybutyrate depolymerase